MCSSRAPTAAAHEGAEGPAASLPHRAGLFASSAERAAPAGALQRLSVPVPSGHRHAPGYRQGCPPGTSTPGCVGASRHLPGLLRPLSHCGERGLGGLRPRPHETRVEPQLQMQTGAPGGKTWQAGVFPPEFEILKNNRWPLVHGPRVLVRISESSLGCGTEDPAPGPLGHSGEALPVEY